MPPLAEPQSKRNDSRADWIALGLAFAYATGVAWFSWKYYPIGRTKSVENDFFAWYASNAEKILAGDFAGISEYRYNPLGYSVALAFFGLVFPNLFAAGKAISVLTSFTALLCVYFLVKRSFGSLFAVMATAATAANKQFFLYSYYVGTDMAFFALACFSLLVLFGKYPRLHGIALAGFLAGFAYWFRYNAVFLIPTGLCYLYFKTPLENVRKRLTFCGVYLAVFISTVLPWHLFLLVRKGRFFYNKNHLNMAYDLLHGNERKDYFSHYLAGKYESLADVLAANPPVFIGNVLKNLINHPVDVFRHLVPEYMGFFVLVGAVLMIKNPREHGENAQDKKYLLLSFLFYFLLMSLIHFEIRYFLYLIPLLSLACVYGIYGIAALMRLPKTIAQAVMSGVLLLVSIHAFTWNIRHADNFNREIVEMGDFMKYMAHPGQKLMSRSANIAYFSGCEYEYLPWIESASELARHTRSQGADFIFYSSVEAGDRPKLDDFLREADGIYFQKILEWRPSDRKSAIYRVLPETGKTGVMDYNRDSFATQEIRERFMEAASHVFERRIVLEGLLRVHDSGTYTLAFSADDFALLVDGKTVLSDKNTPATFVAKPLLLQEGFHAIRLEFGGKPRDIAPPGLFWETPDGTREPVPRTDLIITKVEFEPPSPI